MILSRRACSLQRVFPPHDKSGCSPTKCLFLTERGACVIYCIVCLCFPHTLNRAKWVLGVTLPEFSCSPTGERLCTRSEASLLADTVNKCMEHFEEQTYSRAKCPDELGQSLSDDSEGPPRSIPARLHRQRQSK